MATETITLALTGASGINYGLRLLECLLEAQKQVYLLVSPAAHVVISSETEHRISSRPEEIRAYFADLYNTSKDQLIVFGKEQWMAPIASGSNVADAMVICPCSSASVSSIANGASQDLIERAADVTIKENRPLTLVLREMPLSAIHLENLLKLARLGVTIMPASPGFYHRPTQISQLVDFVVARILDHLKIKHTLLPRWGEELS